MRQSRLPIVCHEEMKNIYSPVQSIPWANRAPSSVFKWVDLLSADTDHCVLADCFLDRRSWRGRPRPLLRGSGSRKLRLLATVFV